MRTPWLIAALVTALALAGCGGAKGPAGTQKPGAAYGEQQKPAAQQGQQPAQQAPQDPNQRPMPNNKQWPSPPAMQIDPNKQYFATIQTNMGDMKVELFAKDSPQTVNNFVFLAKENYYDGIIFHRVLKLFMVQTGDPTGSGMGGPGYKFPDELPPKRPYDLGTVAMANAGPNTNGSQFFICNVPKCGGLDSYPNYTQFGQVVEGLDVLEKLSAVDVTASEAGERSRPVKAPWIKTIVIETK